MGLSVLALAGTEFQRFLRRREGIALPLVMLIAGAMPTLLALMVFANTSTMYLWEEFPALMRLRAVASTAEILVAAMLAHVMAATSLLSERRRGSWTLVMQSPVSESRLLLGKAVGIMTCVAFLHVAFLLALVATTPIVTRTPGLIAFEALAPLLAAAAAIPGGLAEAQVRASGRRYGAFRAAHVLQGLSPVVVLAAFIAPLGPEGAKAALSDIVSGLGIGPVPTVLAAALGSAMPILVAVAIAQALLGALIWRVFVIGTGRA